MKSFFSKDAGRRTPGSHCPFHNLHPASPRLPDGLNVFLGLHPQRGNARVPGVNRAVVGRGRGAHGAHVGQVRAVSQGRGVEEGRRQGGGHGRGRRRCVSAREALRAGDEAR